MKIDFVTQFKNVTFQKQNKDNFSSQKQKDSKDKLLYYTLGGLALAVAGAVLYNKKAGSNKTFFDKNKYISGFETVCFFQTNGRNRTKSGSIR